ncbi:MAG: hypothetical protein EOO53_14120 [Gammaproteobacteria bacterium]|nr:MAG: hypothetical protein EOO53_14120 [Gammaproteobacteria bacterium]
MKSVFVTRREGSNRVKAVLLKLSLRMLKHVISSWTLLLAFSSSAAIVSPPPYEINDRHGVNMATGQVSPSLTDLVMGGNLGLSHTISTYTSNFVNWDDEVGAGAIRQGFQDSLTVRVSEPSWNPGLDIHNKVIKIISEGSTAEFYYSPDRKKYTPKTDSRYILVSADIPANTTIAQSPYHQSIVDFSNSIGGFSGLIMTKPDGTVVYIANRRLNSTSSSSSSSSSSAPVTTSLYSNQGINITINSSLPNQTGNFTISWTGAGHHSYLKLIGSGTDVTQAEGSSSGSYVATGMTPRILYYYLVACPNPSPDGCTAHPLNTVQVDRTDVVWSTDISYVQKPNGLLIARRDASTYSGITSSANTNTGFQFKYLYQYSTINLPSQPKLPSSGAEGWAASMPKYIIAINNAVDSCTIDRNDYTRNAGKSKDDVIKDACPNLTKKWPVVTYNWPDGMPLAMFATTNSFTVTDPEENVTEYVHTPVDTKEYPDSFYRNAVRLTQIKKNNKVVMNYKYETHDYTPNVCYINLNGASSCAPNPGAAARLTKSWVGNAGDDEISYAIGVQGDHGSSSNESHDGYKRISNVNSNQFGITQAAAWDKTVSFDGYTSNRVTSVYNAVGGVKTSMGYESTIPIDPPADPSISDTAKSQNISSLTETYDGQTIRVTTAGGYAKCTLLNYKVCNQATTITDNNGNVTDYAYDPLTGQPSMVTLPADNKGVRSQTRYKYTPYYAYYKQNGATTVTKAATPVYLLSRESKCHTAVANVTPESTAAAGCTNDSEVITEYDYGPQTGVANNLLLRGITVKATTAHGSETHRTCYSYDDFGNRIGQTTPNARLVSCP